MFWKVVGGIVAFFMVVVLAVTMLAVTGAALTGTAVATTIGNLDGVTVQVTGADGNVETATIEELMAESGRIEISGDRGERLTVDPEAGRIVMDGGNGERMVIDGQRGLVFGSDNRPEVTINGRRVERVYNDFDGGFFLRPLFAFVGGLFKLAFWSLVIVGAWLIIRNQRKNDSTPVEKTPEAVA